MFCQIEYLYKGFQVRNFITLHKFPVLIIITIKLDLVLEMFLAVGSKWKNIKTNWIHNSLGFRFVELKCGNIFTKSQAYWPSLHSEVSLSTF